jgi:hypothetical protein
MSGKPQDILQERDRLGRYRPGFNPRITKRMRIVAKLEELRREFFPAGGVSAIDASRLRLAAQHYFTAETAKDAVVAQRATRVAEYLLSKLKPSSAPRPPVADHAAQALETAGAMLDRLGKGDPSAV